MAYSSQLSFTLLNWVFRANFGDQYDFKVNIFGSLAKNNLGIRDIIIINLTIMLLLHLSKNIYILNILLLLLHYECIFKTIHVQELSNLTTTWCNYIHLLINTFRTWWAHLCSSRFQFTLLAIGWKPTTPKLKNETLEPP